MLSRRHLLMSSRKTHFYRREPCRNSLLKYSILRFYIGPGTSSTIASNGGGGGVVAATRGVAAEFSILDYVKGLAARLTG